MLGDRVAAAQRSGQHEADLALLHHVRGAVALAGLRTGIGHQRHAERGAVEVRGLAGIADVELHVVGALQRKKILAAWS